MEFFLSRARDFPRKFNEKAVNGTVQNKYSRLPITRTFKGNRKSPSYQEFDANNRKSGNKQMDGKERQLSNKVYKNGH